MFPKRAQAAVDFLSAYGLAFLILAIALYVIAALAFFNNQVVPLYCNAAPSFACISDALNASGILTVVFSQATGGTMNLHGAACSTDINLTSDTPRFGNVAVWPDTGQSETYYPSTVTQPLQNGVLPLYSSATGTIYVYCYNGNGVDTGGRGSGFNGYLWLNYTFSNLPGTSNTIERVISFSTKYT